MRGFAILPLVTGALILLLGVAVPLRERFSRVSRLFMILAAALTVWLFCFSRMYSAANAAAALFWAKAAFIGIALVPPAVYHFVIGLEHRERAMRRTLQTIWILGALFLLVILATDQIVDGVEQYSWGFYPRYAWASGPYLLYFFYCLGAAMWHAVEARSRASTEIDRRRMRAVMLSLGVGYIACFDYLPSFGVDVLPLGFLAIAGFVAVMGYTVWRYELGEITDDLAPPAVIQALRGAVLIVDLKREIRVASDGACRLLGYSDEQLIGKQIGIVSDALESDADDAAAKNIREKGRELVWRSHDGEAIDVAVNSALLLDRRGRPAGIVYTAEDISRRKREEALRESESRYRALVESMNEGVMVVDLQDQIEFVNERTAQMLGYTARELIGKPSRQFTVSGSGNTVCLRTLRGSELWVNVSEAPLRDGRGKRIGSIRVLTDVTDRRRVELALRESEARYRLLAEHATDMISRHTPDGRFLYASPASTALLGYAPEELIGVSALELIHPEDRHTIQDLRSALTGSSDPAAASFRMRHKDGSYVRVETTWRPVTANTKREIVAVSRNITERLRAVTSE